MNPTFATLVRLKLPEGADGADWEIDDKLAQVGKVYTVDLDRKKHHRRWCKTHRKFHEVEVIWAWDEDGQGWLPTGVLEIQGEKEKLP